MHPLLILGISIAVVLFLIIKLKVNAFLALIAAAMTVGLLASIPSTAYPPKTGLGYGAQECSGLGANRGGRY